MASSSMSVGVEEQKKRKKKRERQEMERETERKSLLLINGGRRRGVFRAERGDEAALPRLGYAP